MRIRPLHALRFSLACLLLATSVSCSNPRNQVIPSDPEKWPTELKPALDKLPEEERTLVTQYVLRVKMASVFGGDNMPAGMTVGRAIDEQRAFLRDQEAKEAAAKALAEKERKEREAQIAALNQAVTVALVAKDFSAADYTEGTYQDYITMVFAFQNKTQKNIAGVKGLAIFADIFGDTISAIRMSYDRSIPAGKTVRWSAQTDYNQFADKDVKLRNTSLDRLTFRFEPLTIIFGDGTRLDVAVDE